MGHAGWWSAVGSDHGAVRYSGGVPERSDAFRDTTIGDEMSDRGSLASVILGLSGGAFIALVAAAVARRGFLGRIERLQRSLEQTRTGSKLSERAVNPLNPAAKGREF